MRFFPNSNNSRFCNSIQDGGSLRGNRFRMDARNCQKRFEGGLCRSILAHNMGKLRSHGNMLAAWNTSRILDSAAKSKIPLLVFIGCHNTAVDEFPNTYFRMARTPASRRISAANAFMAWAYSRRPISAK